MAHPLHAMKAHGGLVAELHSFLISALDTDERSVSRSGHFITGDREPQYPMRRMLGETNSRSESFG
jgi:hypothetical protein